MKLARQKRLLEFFEWLAVQMIEPLPRDLLRLSLTYALHADSHLDVERIYHTLQHNPPLREQTMSIAQQLIARGKAEGNVEGRLQLLQELMGLPVTPGEELAALSLEELQARFHEVQLQYNARFKNG